MLLEAPVNAPLVLLLEVPPVPSIVLPHTVPGFPF